MEADISSSFERQPHGHHVIPTSRLSGITHPQARQLTLISPDPHASMRSRKETAGAEVALRVGRLRLLSTQARKSSGRTRFSRPNS
jgi:hypothetical protein